MKKLGETHVSCEAFTGKVEIKQWERGDPFPQLGSSVGVDTETELITDTVLHPPLVVTGVFDPASSTCWLIDWKNTPAFMQQLCSRDIEQRYFNLGFDEGVLDKEDEKQSLLLAINEGRVRDMQIRVHCHAVATTGFIRGNQYSLADCALHYLNLTLDKGSTDPAESHRTTFKRHNIDGSVYALSEKQIEYAATDCVATWALGEIVPVQATEIQHTKGMVVLARIQANGLPIDPVVFEHLEKMLLDDRDTYRLQLVDHGFPDPYKDEQRERLEVISKLFREMQRFNDTYRGPLNLPVIDVENSGSGEEDTLEPDVTAKLPSKQQMRLMLTYMHNFADSAEENINLAETIIEAFSNPKMTYGKMHKVLYAELCEAYGLISFDEATKKIAMLALVAYTLEALNNQADIESNGYDVVAAIEYASNFLDEHPEWIAKTEKVGPRKFFQTHVKSVVEANPSLVLETTPKSGDIKMTLKDKWRLEVLGIEDKFLDSYMNFNHCQKYLSTYMNRDFIKSDGKVHPRFTNYLRTGRTSCSKPNVQNLPSRDPRFPLRNMYTAPEGAILCATDFSFIELCAFAQTSYSRFGVSVMRDVINAGIDPHRWFAGVMTKKITTDLSKKEDADWVTETNTFLKEVVSDAERQKAKAANFGFPGALGVKTFYRNCRENGVVLTIEEAQEMRNAWVNTFVEMKKHMKPTEVKQTRFLANPYGMGGGDEDDIDIDESEQDRRQYCCMLPSGQFRNRCSYNAACNTQFQGTTAIGAKVAGWNLVYNGYAERLYNFVHDEYMYYLYPEELMEHIPYIEQLMIAGMKTVIPDVKVGVESSVMIHWNKKAIAFEDLKWEDGRPVISEPEIVVNAYKNIGEQK